jgi:hypothetical protein
MLPVNFDGQLMLVPPKAMNRPTAATILSAAPFRGGLFYPENGNTRWISTRTLALVD